ncbi:MAG: TrkH family potassium uptake protein, partial [Enterococcus viikkiensis]
MNFERRINFFKKNWRKLNNRFSSIQVIVFYYLAMTILALFLFSLPIFREPGSHVSLLDLIFMAISTISVTGLTTIDINSTFNNAGVVMLEVLFHIGGLG